VTTKDSIVASLQASMEGARCVERPYRHWFLRACLPEEAVEQIVALPFEAPALDGVSGKRELHNATRKYFDVPNRQKFPVCEAFCQAFQERALTRMLTGHFGAKLAGTFLRVEFAQDIDSFWLEPHTDLGVKSFTMLLYLSKDPRHGSLGTDIYDSAKRHVGCSPFVANSAMVFVPSTDTFHGFEPRKIEGVRISLIINYVTNEWRAREQLAFPSAPLDL
jgi:hypothetical protein